MFYVNHPTLKPHEAQDPGRFLWILQRIWFSISRHTDVDFKCFFYTFGTWTDCLSLWLHVAPPHALVCLFATTCLPVVVVLALSGQVWNPPPERPGLNRVQTPPSRYVTAPPAAPKRATQTGHSAECKLTSSINTVWVNVCVCVCLWLMFFYFSCVLRSWHPGCCILPSFRSPC